MSVNMKRHAMNIPTYTPGAPNDLPFFLEKKAYQGATGRVYPLPYTDKLSNHPVDKDYDAVTLENEYIEVVLLPELGGKIHGAKAKHNGYEFIYQNSVSNPRWSGLRARGYRAVWNSTGRSTTGPQPLCRWKLRCKPTPTAQKHAGWAKPSRFTECAEWSALRYFPAAPLWKPKP